MIITLLTDFGLSDPYVGSMKGVILNINPDARIVDITHDISPQNVDEAAFVLKRVSSYFPGGTIHVVVVDPGVGSERAILAVQAENYIFLAPDNGVLKYIFDDEPDARVFRLTNRAYFLEKVSHTFHGRDIFAPVAAHISMGISLERLGEPFDDYIVGDVKKPVEGKTEITGEIIHVDKFGNGVTNIDGTLLKDRSKTKIRIKGYELDELCRAYNNVPVGEPLALVGSGGTLEISVHGGDAQKRMGFVVGDSVTVFIG